MKRFIERFYVAIIFIFLYAPIVTLIVLSFNSSRTRAKWGGFTTHWYSELFKNDAIMQALYNTIFIAIISSVIATLIGTITCIALNNMKARPKTLLLGMNNIPMLNADIVTGISLMLLFISFGFRFGMQTILLAHITFNIPYIILNVMPKFRQLNPNTYEAALDLGASPVYAFFKVIFPDILPGILSGFLMAFTMSLDDFIITHFTKGAGVDTLSTKIYTEVRKGIKPEMYALSTIIFITVFVLLLIVNISPSKEKQPGKHVSFVRRYSKQFAAAAVALILIVGSVFLFQGKGSQQVIVYNWGEYLDPEVLTLFEEETGIEVVYDEYETNETMYPKVASKAADYDVVCPSDYMIQKMIENDLLAEINFDNVPNIKNIDPNYINQSKDFDPENKYSVPYCVGTVGILYNKTMVDEPVDSWDILWNDKYKDNILMQDSVRDAFMVALKKLGYSMDDMTSQGLVGLSVMAKQNHQLASELGIGEVTLTDIVKELEKPGRDPREEMPKPILRTDVLDMKDLAEGMVLKGTVRNVIDFGAFVDIGVHQDGLVHISQITNKKFIKHPLEVVSVGDVVEVKVLSVDLERKRIQLSMILDA